MWMCLSPGCCTGQRGTPGTSMTPLHQLRRCSFPTHSASRPTQLAMRNTSRPDTAGRRLASRLRPSR